MNDLVAKATEMPRLPEAEGKRSSRAARESASGILQAARGKEFEATFYMQSLSRTPPCPLAPNQRAQARIARRRRDTLPDHWGCEKVSVQGCGAGVAFEAANGPLVAGSMLHTFHGYSVDGNAGFNREMGQKAGTEVVKSETGSLRIGRA